MAESGTMSAPTFWHRLDRALAKIRPHRRPLSLLIDGVVIALCWNFTYRTTTIG
jgi:hypothetical protein